MKITLSAVPAFALAALLATAACGGDANNETSASGGDTPDAGTSQTGTSQAGGVGTTGTGSVVGGTGSTLTPADSTSTADVGPTTAPNIGNSGAVGGPGSTGAPGAAPPSTTP